MLIPHMYILEEGKEIPENTTIKTCRFCNKRFAIPNDVITGKNYTNACDSEECKKKINAEVANIVHMLMNADKIKDTTEALKKALGE